MPHRVKPLSGPVDSDLNESTDLFDSGDLFGEPIYLANPLDRVRHQTPVERGIASRKEHDAVCDHSLPISERGGCGIRPILPAHNSSREALVLI